MVSRAITNRMIMVDSNEPGQALEISSAPAGRRFAAHRCLLPRHASSAMLWIYPQADVYAAG